MSKKSRDTSTLFELISQAGGRIKGVTPAARQADDAQTDEAPAPALSPPEPAPLPELAEVEPIPAPAAEPAAAEPAEPAAAGPAEAVAESVDTATQVAPAPPPDAPPAKPKPRPMAKRKTARKRTTNVAAKVPAGPGRQAKPKAKKRPAAQAERTGKKAAAVPAKKPAKKSVDKPAKVPADEPDGEPIKPASLLDDVAAAPHAEPAPEPMPAGFAPPAHLQPKGRAAPRPAATPSVMPVPSAQLIGLAVAAALVIVTFVVGFIVGRATAPRDGAQAGQTTVAAIGNGQPGPSGRIEGMNYLIVQELTGNTSQDRTDAFDIQSFCEANGRLADVRRYTKDNGREVYAVLSFEPFELPHSPEATAFALKIEQLGREYEAQGGNYRFQQRPSRSAPLRPRFELWREPPQD